MSALDINPLSANFLSPLNFNFKLKRSPTLNFFVQEVNIPSISYTVPEQTNQFVNIPMTGDHMNYGELHITFKVDEYLYNYLDIHNWMKSLTFPDNFDQYAAIKAKPIIQGEGITSDIVLSIANSVKIPVFEVVFRDAFPVYLSELKFETTARDVDYMTAQAHFRYIMYDINRV